MTRRHAICGVGALMLAAFACGATVGAVNRPSLPSQLPERSQDAKPVALAAKPVDTTFDTKIKPFLATYCNSCHNSTKQAGSVTLDAYLNENHAKKDRMTWETIVDVVASGEMPPKKKLQPSKDEKEAFLGWVENTMIKVDCTSPKDPGRVTLRRLNRAEYNNTIRDLFGVDFQPASTFPADDTGYGFDNIGDVLTLPPVLLERYLEAAEQVARRTIVAPDEDFITETKKDVKTYDNDLFDNTGGFWSGGEPLCSAPHPGLEQGVCLNWTSASGYHMGVATTLYGPVIGNYECRGATLLDCNSWRLPLLCVQQAWYSKPG